MEAQIQGIASNAESEPNPTRLYHYTTLESLALILENRTIRLMPIEGMDDLQESHTADVQNLGRFIFASCWTDDATESIPMWNMYASLEAGVRICLPSMPFRRYRLTAEECAREYGVPLDHVNMEGEYFETFLPPADLAKGLMCPSAVGGQDVLFKVEYTSNKELLEPRVLSTENEEITLTIDKLGGYKNEYWSFQNEWRYQLTIVPFRVLDIENALERFSVMVTMMAQGILPSPCSYYDLHIADEAMDEFEVVASPKMSEGNRLLLRSLLEKHDLETSLKDSQLTGLI